MGSVLDRLEEREAQARVLVGRLREEAERAAGALAAADESLSRLVIARETVAEILDGESDQFIDAEVAPGAAVRGAARGDHPPRVRPHPRTRIPVCATRRSAISPAEREEIGGISLGLMAYPDSKGKGNNSMPGNRWLRPGVRGGASGGPRDMAKPGLAEAQSPEGAIRHPSERRLKPAPPPAAGSRGTCCSPSEAGAMPSQGIQGDEWAA